jgi:uncharacterized protein YecA (UPF0149 family)
MFNNTRMDVNRGYTPAEMLKITTEDCQTLSAFQYSEMDMSEMLENIWWMDVPNHESKAAYINATDQAKREEKPSKVGRNDPCPLRKWKKV